jgi:hypothetical protein
MFNLLWDIYQQGRVNDTARDVGDMRSEASSLQRRIDELERQVEGLTLACTAMWSLVKGQTGLTEDQLAARVRDLDLSDGKLDGRMAREPQRCPGCGRQISPRHQRCLYCGKGVRTSEPFGA